MWLYHKVTSPKDAVGMANNEDPDLGLHCLSRPICLKTKDNYGKTYWFIPSTSKSALNMRMSHGLRMSHGC